ncbi:DoxX family protein [Alcaligenes sp. SDU_A2]|uniref:DoxX family protein n=1 Tax=Alcaligenes sp. SDU_A2 TaxID=3136634 RepID=UPI0031204B3D
MSAVTSPWTSRVLSILRIVTGYLLLTHGTAKILGFPKVDMFANLQLTSMYGVAGILELILGALLVIGLFSRFAAFIASGLCAAAYFIGHASENTFPFPLLNGGEAAVLFCFAFLYLAVAGPGPWSVDAARQAT